MLVRFSVPLHGCSIMMSGLSLWTVQDPQRAKGMLGGAAALFQLRLLDAYLAVPNAAAFASEHQALIRLCSRAFRGSTAPTTSVPGT